MTRIFVGLAASLFVLTSCSAGRGLRPGPGFQKSLQEAMITAKPGSVIEIPEGRHEIDAVLTLSADKVTLRGMGMEKSILSFKKQTSGSAGLMVTGNGFVIEDLAVEDTKGDGLKVKGSTGVTIRRFRAEWTGGSVSTNGAYGIYPVESNNVLIEDSVVIGAADAGIYVGQSKNIIVRRNTAKRNVAGIEIENSVGADVYDNTATENTGGILVFNLPDLPMKGGRQTRVYKNRIEGNNTSNFAPKGAMVAKVPSGTGLMVLATAQAEIFNNSIKDNQTANISILSYLTTGNKIQDAEYDPFVEAIYIHNNQISGGGNLPGGRAMAIAEAAGAPLPHIQYDGIVNPKRAAIGDLRICIENNDGVTFLNYDAGGGFKKLSRDLKPHTCALPALAPIVLPGA